jgi:hypothetical protein
MEGSLGPDQLPAELVGQVEALARRLGCDSGERQLEFKLVDGRLVRTYLQHGPIKNQELEALARAVGVLRD